ncbi:hypothetical protein F5Y02DRAFT_422169 [Annulohypoxylon stygium]|nr:hypothetical protein F5Y02DRAFT_422169 [Annulohypoxylon stygium]
MASRATLNDTEIQFIRSQPALSPPDGVIPNFVDPPNNNKLAIAVISICISLVTILFLIRIITRIFYVRKTRIEDYIGLLGFVFDILSPFHTAPFFIAAAVKLATMTSSRPGLFVRQWNMLVVDYEAWLHTYVLVSTLYCVVLGLVKIAIILEWIHFFIPRATRNKFFWTCYAMIGTSSCLYISTIFVFNLACNPRERTWRRYLPGTCINIYVSNLLINTLHLIFNIALLLIPYKRIWKLAISFRQKILIYVVFSVGIMNCVCAAGRLACSISLVYSTDPSYDYSGYLIWGLAECSTGWLIFCAPAIPAFRNKFQIPDIGVRFRQKVGTFFPLGPPEGSAQRLSRPQASYRSTDPVIAPWMDDDSAVNIAELGPVRTRDSGVRDRFTEDDLAYGGILRTTEIAVTSEISSGVMISPHQVHPQPWLDCESSD